jgi:hypothetical protein
MSGWSLAVAALVGVVLSAALGDAAMLCRRGTGKIVRREACRKAEQVLDSSRLDLSALAGAQGDPGAPGTRGQHPLRLVDNVGVELGPIQAFYSGNFVAVVISSPVLIEPVQFLVERTGFVHNIGGAQSFVAYSEAGCAGVPFVSSGFLSVVQAQVYGTAAYYPTGPSQSRSILSSEIDPNGNPCSASAVLTARGTCCSNGNTTTNLAPAVRVPLADLGFIPPFRAEPR